MSNDVTGSDSSRDRSRNPSVSEKQGPQIYLSWGGEIYGPATEDEINNGLRTCWFEEGTLYWKDGLQEWRPISDFSAAVQQETGKSWRSRRVEGMREAPALPRRDNLGRRRSNRSDRARSSKSRHRSLGHRGRAIVFGFAALAVALTVAILLLLMLI